MRGKDIYFCENKTIISKMNLKKTSIVPRHIGHFVCFILGALLLTTLIASPVEATESDGLLEAGLIEWGDGYLKATEGFEFFFEGKRIAGDEIFIDTLSSFSVLNQIHFTGCVYEHPHYLIHAKRLEIYAKEKLVFTGARIQAGSLQLPIPFALVLTYKDGTYQFPQWIPELIYSREAGVGLKFNGTLQPTKQILLSGSLTLTQKAGVSTNLIGTYRVLPDLRLRGEVTYDDGWNENGAIYWRQGKQGFTGQYIQYWTGKDYEKQSLTLSYNQQNWKLQSRNSQEKTSPWKSTIELLTNGEWHGVSYKTTSGISKVTDPVTEESLPKISLSQTLEDSYRYNKVGLGWQVHPTTYWVPDYGFSGNVKTDLWVKTLNSQGFNAKVGYGRNDFFGEQLPTTFGYTKPVEYVSTEVSYNWRNQLDEGWDVGISANYSLVEETFSKGELRVVRALDCFDWKLNIDLVNESAKVGLELKY